MKLANIMILIILGLVIVVLWKKVKTKNSTTQQTSDMPKYGTAAYWDMLKRNSPPGAINM